MSNAEFDLNLIPTWRQGYRFQFEPAQNAFVILYPEGMIKLNDSAGAIGQHINGQQNVADIVALLKQQFGDIAEIEQDVVDYMRVAQQQYWIDLR
ncbi:pyrroloquinoline quinone biosynthesis peptide chaperone PqqD [Acinetobacter vivianii]|uniref:PqqA binding protein n=1 Tax=Acinetobacter vivianii TaxID=1776742 RepID=A0AAJ6NIA2_9GAMM|nr:pyrroloquinoline quinone biosynthesis peptide chaperone PqqD [Acinetobacter vivianii]MEB6668188.1 pyrroloquinoline quinone biosynthesis peptide chaperone PqqD [Acinetobacter vivianii]WDZ50876.1 pyrroloquinoline quinone biosynthesis peptide chaperone PqqD [Acinetobacter vivianii]